MGKFKECNCYTAKARFSGWKVPDQGTRPPFDLRTIRSEWDGFNEEQYDYESRRRWGRW